MGLSSLGRKCNRHHAGFDGKGGLTMSKMSEKVAYLKGLAEGLGVSGESRE